MFNIGLLIPHISTPVGQQVLTASSGTWTCPAGVTSVCVVLVGKGGDGAGYPGYGSFYGAGGGALTYKNNHTVTPGATYAWSINETSSTMFSMIAGAGGNASAGGGAGGAGGASNSYSGSPTASYAGGNGLSGGSRPFKSEGSAARYDAAGTPGNGYSYGTGVSLTENAAGSYGCGKGEGTGPGEPGAIRIIWGDGRSFPNNAADA